MDCTSRRAPPAAHRWADAHCAEHTQPARCIHLPKQNSHSAEGKLTRGKHLLLAFRATEGNLQMYSTAALKEASGKQDVPPAAAHLGLVLIPKAGDRTRERLFPDNSDVKPCTQLSTLTASVCSEQLGKKIINQPGKQQAEIAEVLINCHSHIFHSEVMQNATVTKN